MKESELFTLLKGRFMSPSDTQENWRNNNPYILPGELIVAADANKLKIGNGKRYTDTPFLYGGADHVNMDYSSLPQANDSNIKPSNSTGHNVEDFLQTNGDILYPITTTTAVKLVAGTTLQSWMDNITTKKINIQKDSIVRELIKATYGAGFGIDVAIGAEGKTVLYSGEYANIKNIAETNPGDENLILSADGTIYLYVDNCLSNLRISPTKEILPHNTNTWSLGSSTLKLANIWATNLNGALKGNADTATKLAMPRKINLTNQVIGSVPFDGSTDVTLDVSLPSTITLGGGETAAILQNSGQHRQLLQIMDNGTNDDEVFIFSQSSDNGVSYKTLMSVYDNGNVKANSFIGALSGNANTASKLQNSRSITIGNIARSFDGSSNVTWSLADLGAMPVTKILQFKNISVPVASWNASTKRFEYANASITANHSPDVRFAKSSIDAAGKSAIIAYTEAGKLVLEATSSIPTVALIIEVMFLTNTT